MTPRAALGRMVRVESYPLQRLGLATRQGSTARSGECIRPFDLSGVAGARRRVVLAGSGGISCADAAESAGAAAPVQVAPSQRKLPNLGARS